MSEIFQAVNKGSRPEIGRLRCVLDGRFANGSDQAMLIKSSTEQVRQQNSVLVLSALRRHGPQAHTDLSERTGLASATVSAITADLERVGVIGRSEQPPAGGRGRPRTLFSQQRAFGYLITAQISSDIVHYSLVDYAGRLIDRFDEPRSHQAPDAARFAQSFLEALGRLAERSRIAPDDVMAISISSKGTVDAAGGVLLWSPLLGGAPIDFAALAAPRWKARVTLSNETLLVAQALATRQDEADPDQSRLAVVSLGHSIGLGIARRDRAGEIEASAPNFGHMLDRADGGLCRCGAFGCIEASAGFYGILRTAFQVPPDTIPAKFVPLGEMDKIALSARQGNRMASYAFRMGGLALGNGLSRLLSLYGRLPIFMTGPGTRYLDLLNPGIEEALGRSHEVRLLGRPPLSIIADEPGLVFDGHLDRALTEMDHVIAETRLGLRDSRTA